MIIKFLDKQYEVIQRIKNTRRIDVYLVKDLNSSEKKNYTAACMKDKELIKQLIPLTTKKNTSLSFRNLRDSFNSDGKYYIIFDHASGDTLQQALENNKLNFKERLLLVKNIFGQILMLNMPECFVYEVLRKDNMIVDEALGVQFNYYFTEIDYYEQADENMCLRRFHELLVQIFHKEIVNKNSPELKEFLDDLERGRFECIWDCYETYDEIYDRLTLAGGDDLRPKRFWWRAWEWFKKIFPKLKAAATFILIVSAAIYLLVTLENPMLSDEGIRFQQIGTLQIQEQGILTDK